LHYCCNDREFSWGPLKPHDHHNSNALRQGSTKEFDPQVLLIDAGCEWNCYASDITRTMPVGNGGKFTSEARAIYELVLKMQKVRLPSFKLSHNPTFNQRPITYRVALLRSSQTRASLGRHPVNLPPDPCQRLPSPWDLQEPFVPWIGVMELRRGYPCLRRQCRLLPARSWPLTWHGRA